MAHPAEMPTAVSRRVTSEALPQLIQVFPLPVVADGVTPVLRKCDAPAKAPPLEQINFLDHVVAGQPRDPRPAFFSFKQAGLL